MGGTSVSAHGLAGIINLAGISADTTLDELTTIYGNFTNTSDFTEIISGSVSRCHPNPHRTCYSAVAGWDFLTGAGISPGTGGK